MGHRSTDYKEGAGMGLRRAQAIIFAEIGKVLMESDRNEIPSYRWHEAMCAANSRMAFEASVYFKQNDKARAKAKVSP